MSLVFTCSADDGHPADLTLAGLLREHGLPGTFYFPIRNQEGGPVLSGAGMRQVAAQFEIGSHTLDHQFLTRVGAAQAGAQIVRGKRELEDRLGRRVAGFCYPGGRYRPLHIGQVRAAGFDYARTTLNLCLDAGANRYEMATTCQFYPHARAVYLRNYLRGGAWPQRAGMLLRALGEPDWERRLYAMFAAAERRGGVFHLWLHTADVEAQSAWPALAGFLAHVAARVPPSRRLSNGALALRSFGALKR
ncbi:polysaccharide deacetylase family protein [Pseudoduganella aquatica]|uniref:Polysaccharide deacetylase family protein n=1 Tax=Pseudoduganella aquatica TaxID=2660641 RepID=A0A7X4HGE3_9BURK|nr:polysaccharide deacetylase family protein [Pseudoduganella aquatica]MYN10773.1 polysaccharide deacetylase family protein [Pseudoduganella aquatica]